HRMAAARPSRFATNAARLRDDAEHPVFYENELGRRFAGEVARDRLALERELADVGFRSACDDLQPIANLAVNLHDDGYRLVAREIRVELRPRLQMNGRIV